MRSMIHPELDSEDYAQNVLQLRDLFRLPEVSAIPVESFDIQGGSMEMRAAVSPSNYELALFLFYCMCQYANGWASFKMPDYGYLQMKQYFGLLLLESEALRVLRQQPLYIRLILKPNYINHAATARCPEEIIRDGWEQRDRLQSDSPAPFLRSALSWFIDQMEHHHLPISNLSDQWPNEEWVSRVLFLHKKLSGQLVHS